MRQITFKFEYTSAWIHVIRFKDGNYTIVCVQMLKAWGAHVTVTCSQNAEQFVRGLGADHVVDYTAGPVEEPLSALEK